MNKNLVIIFCFSFFIISTLSFECGEKKVRKSHNLIVNGEPSYPGQWPWLASLHIVSDRFHYFCGASIITKTVLLTAAHCINATKSYEIIAMLGQFNVSDPNEPNGIQKNILSRIVHPDYNKNDRKSESDIAILIMESEVEFTDYIQPICLPHSNNTLSIIDGTVAGYGSPGPSSQPRETPFHLKMRSIDLIDCLFDQHNSLIVMSKRSFCAGGFGQTPCKGDSGSGFIRLIDDKWTILGVVSHAFDDQCKTTDQIAFANVTVFIDWIQEVTLNYTFTSKSNGTQEQENVCSQSAQEAGECDDWVLKYSFDPLSRSCKPYYYGGCGGNNNRFDSRDYCESQCISRNFQEIQQQSVTSRTRANHCGRFERHCDSLSCQYGIIKSYEVSSRCEKCSCADPCEYKECPQDSKCSIDVSSNELGETVFFAVCRQHEKPGTCPRLDNDSDQCEVECYDDADCREENKCCVSGCSRLCVSPADERKPTNTSRSNYAQEEKAAALEEVPEEDLRPVARVGAVATLRCFATGFPPPSITWKKNGLIINTDQGRYLLTSPGDLQIAQLYRTDAGTYDCNAYNGIGDAVERQIFLTINVPVTANIVLSQGTVYSVGAVIHLHCNASGFPPPEVQWYKDNREIELSDQVELTNPNTLIINNAQPYHSGNYRCVARNNYSQAIAAEIISIEGVHAPSNCTDNKNYANCHLIVKGNWCYHKYYRSFCCRSCTLAGYP